MTRFDGAVGPIAVATRSGFDESVHHGAGVALDASGRAVAGVGDADLTVYPRSCLKPLQADAMVGAGLALPPEQLAVVCASHDGSRRHLDAVLAILGAHGLTADDLANTASRPHGAAARRAAREAGVEPSPLQQNCSGKHAGMLATCRVNGWPTIDYLDPAHPLQQAITAHIEALGCPVHHIGVDGCGAPTHALALRDLARAFAHLAASRTEVASAMAAHPTLVAGPERDVTRWMVAVPGLIAKDGAAGVFAAATADGRAVAFKIADGSGDARRAVVPAALTAMGIDVASSAPEVVAAETVPVLGHGRVVGAIEGLEWEPCSS